ncbi:unnamed protein product, partial [Rotaria socialis]
MGAISCARVTIHRRADGFPLILNSVLVIDSCKVNNGDCDSNATCTHDSVTFAVVCSCPIGFVRSGCGVTAGCVDSCKVENGGCDGNAACAHDSLTNAVVCTCNKGYTNTGFGNSVYCT